MTTERNPFAKSRLRFKRVMRYDAGMKMLRLCRWTWEDGECSHKFSLALRPKLFKPLRSPGVYSWEITVLGVRIHHQRAYGGIQT
jgi:hypothetical protein